MKETFEIQDTKNFLREEAEFVVGKHYPARLTYRGQEFFDSVYSRKIMPFADKAIEAGDSQESYLGYLPEHDVFVSGWDRFEGDWKENTIFFKFDEDMKAYEVNGKVSGVGLFYEKEGSYNSLRELYPTLVDIRLS